jgi:hypothetical protein
MPFDTQDRIRQANNEWSQCFAFRPGLVEGLIQSFLKALIGPSLR